MKTSSLISRSKRLGFSLVELLVVVGIIALLLVMTAPSMTAAFKGSKLSQGSEALRNLIHQARQVALKNNLPVEVRIFKYDDPETPETTEFYMAAQIYLLRLDFTKNENALDSGLKEEKIGNLLKLPAGIIINDSVRQSSLLDKTKVLSGTTTVKGLDPNQKESDAQFVGFQIRADGSLNLSKERWFVTLINREEVITERQETPKDYVCLQVNLQTCDVRAYRPN